MALHRSPLLGVVNTSSARRVRPMSGRTISLLMRELLRVESLDVLATTRGREQGIESGCCQSAAHSAAALAGRCGRVMTRSSGRVIHTARASSTVVPLPRAPVAGARDSRDAGAGDTLATPDPSCIQYMLLYTAAYGNTKTCSISCIQL